MTSPDARTLARLIADELAARPPARYVDVKGVAAYLSVGADWVYDHQHELGVVRLGDGKRAALRFDLQTVDEYLTACKAGKGSETAQTVSTSGNRPGRPRRYQLRAPDNARLAARSEAER